MRYMGMTIRECERAQGEHAGKWIIQAHHLTGYPLSDELCLHFHTIAEAKAAIRTELADRALASA